MQLQVDSVDLIFKMFDNIRFLNLLLAYFSF